MVVTPYNAQVRLLRQLLPDWVDVRHGNVDFLYSRNRLNVAASRAKCLAVLVARPALLTVRCRTVEQMRLVNALCRFVEMAVPSRHSDRRDAPSSAPQDEVA